MYKGTASRTRQPRSVIKRLKATQMHLYLLCGFLMCFLLPGLLGWYPLTKKFRHTICDTPNTCGALVSDWFRGYDWYSTSLYVLMLPVCFIAMSTLVFLHTAWWLKIMSIVLSALVALTFTGFFVTDISIMVHANDPSDPFNPASSLYRCCAPQYYTTVTSCENYGAVNASCTPPRTLAELGFDGPFVAAFVFRIFYIVSCVVMIIYVADIIALVDEFQRNGDVNFEKKDLMSSDGSSATTPYYVPQYNQPPPSAPSSDQSFELPPLQSDPIKAAAQVLRQPLLAQQQPVVAFVPQPQPPTVPVASQMNSQVEALLRQTK